MLISWKITAYVYLIKAERLQVEAIPAEYQAVVAERLIVE
ncbi:CD1375 family protein [Pelosinus baikalensis]|nr:CD1375 family protein [Pelosinus baikalensis]